MKRQMRRPTGARPLLRNVADAAICVVLVFSAIQCASGQTGPVSDPEAVAFKAHGFVMHNPELKLPPEHEVTDRVEIKTSKGSFVVGLYGKSAPRTVANFLSYVDRGFYAGKIFHRIIPGFMIQGGGFDAELNRAPTDAPIKLEIIPGLRHEPGVISMARTADPHSATSQFFVCVTEALQLNGTYAAFGKVETGYEVVEAISNVPTKTVEAQQGMMSDVPSTPVLIESIIRLTSQ